MKQIYILLFIFLFCKFQYATAQVNADFSINYPAQNCVPTAISFTNLSTGVAPLTYQWNFGVNAGVNSTLSDPATTYSICGSYNVTLTVTNGLNQSSTKTKTVTTYCQPLSNFSVANAQGCSPLLVNFQNASIAGSASISNYVWDFGDGYSGSGSNPSHSYTTPGCKSVTLIVTNSNGCSDDTTFTNLICPSVHPTANFTSSATSGCAAPFNVNYAAAASGATPPYAYQWRFNGGTPSISTSANPTVIYNTPGNFNTLLIVTDARGCTDTIRKSNLINVASNVADFSINNLVGCAPLQAYASGISTSFVQSWSWTTTPVGTPATSTSQDEFFTFSSPGTYNVCLTENFSSTCSTSRCTTVVVNTSPHSQFSATGNIATCAPPLNVRFTNNSTGSGLTYKWLFPGGTPSFYNGTTPPVINYNSCGNFPVTLITINGAGCTDTLIKSNLVNIDCPIASIISSASQGCVPLDVSFNSTGSFGSPTQWLWNFGDTPNPNTIQSTAQNPLHTFTNPGCYTIRLIIKNAQGCTDTIIETSMICAGSIPIAQFISTPATGCISTPIRFTNQSSGVFPYSTYAWDFHGVPDYDVESTLLNPNYTYPDTGIFDITLIVSNYGCSDTLSKNHLVHIFPPVAKVIIIKNCVNSYTLKLDGRSSVGANTYFWNIPGGTPATATTDTVNVTFPASNRYISSLLVTNTASGCSNTYTFNNYIRKIRSGFSLIDSIGCAPYTFCINNTSIDATYCYWTIKNAAGNVVSTLNSLTPCPTITAPGVYSIQLIAVDYNGCRDTTFKRNCIVVYGTLVNFSATHRQGCTPLTSNFTDMSSSLTSNAIGWSWDFGDPGSGSNNHSTLHNASHIYNYPGSYNVTLAVTDDHGCISYLTQSNFINPQQPLVQFTADSIVCLGNQSCFNNSTLGGMIYNWNFGDNSTSILTNPCHIYSNTGIYPVTLIATDGLGCVGSLTKNNYVKVLNPMASFYSNVQSGNCPPLSVNFTNASTGIDSSFSYYWNFGDNSYSTAENPFHIYNRAGSFTVTLIIRNQIGCSDTLTFPNYIILHGPSANIQVSNHSGCSPLPVCFIVQAINTTGFTWNFGDGNLITNTLDSMCYTYNNQGIYYPQLILNDSLGCSYSLSIDTINIADPIAYFSADKHNVCIYDFVNFTDSSVSPSATLRWSWNFGDISSTSNTSINQNPSHTFSTMGIHPVTLSITNQFGCTAIFTDTIYVVAPPVAKFLIDDTTVCPGTTVLFKDISRSVNPITTYNYNFGDPSSGIQNTSNLPNPSHIFNQAGNFTITLTITSFDDCTGSISTKSYTAKVKVYSRPPVKVAHDISICIGTASILHAEGAVSYQWTPFINLSNTAIADPIANPAITTQYKVTGTDSHGCMNKDSITVHVISPFTGTKSPDAQICYGSNVQMNAAGGNIYKWTPSNGLNNANIPDPVASPTENTTYQVIISDGICFADTQSIKIVVNPLPTVYAGADRKIFSGQTTTLIATSPATGRYLWTPDEYISCDTCKKTIAAPQHTTTYNVYFTSSQGCRVSDSVVVFVGCDDNVMYLPNAFSPNNDGQNDQFLIRSQGIKSLEYLRIFDRWGELVFESNDISHGWDGTFKGTPMAPGVYIYYMQAVCSNDQIISYQGNITLLR